MKRATNKMEKTCCAVLKVVVSNGGVRASPAERRQMQRHTRVEVEVCQLCTSPPLTSVETDRERVCALKNKSLYEVWIHMTASLQ